MLRDRFVSGAMQYSVGTSLHGKMDDVFASSAFHRLEWASTVCCCYILSLVKPWLIIGSEDIFIPLWS